MTTPRAPGSTATYALEAPTQLHAEPAAPPEARMETAPEGRPGAVPGGGMLPPDDPRAGHPAEASPTAPAAAERADGAPVEGRTAHAPAGGPEWPPDHPAAVSPARPAAPVGAGPASRRHEARPGTAASADDDSGGERVARRGPVDPVKALMHRHRELCERAVDPLEIAAGLEAHGVTDRTAAHFRHRDVFALAEEMYARVPRATEHTPVPVRPARAADSRAGRTGPAPWILRALLPGAVCVLAVAGTEAVEGTLRLIVGVAGAVGVAVTVALCLRRGPLRAKGRTVHSVRMWTPCLLAFAVCGQGLVQEVAGGGPDAAWAMDPAPLVGLALAVAPAACCAHLFSVLARRRLERCRALDEFAAGARPLLFAVLLLHLGALIVLLALTGLVLPGGSIVPTAALGTLLFLARLLIVHGFPEQAATALAAACAVEAAAPALLLAGRLPGLGVLARPVEAVVGAWGVAAVPALACGAAAAGLLAHAAAALSRASAHTL